MTTTFYIKTAGCSANVADSEQMAGLLKEAKFELVNDPEDAYIIIFNTCTVKSPTENVFFKELKEFEQKYPNKLIIIAGCISQTDPKKLKKYPLIGTKQIHNIVQVVEEALNDNVIKMLSNDELPPLNLPKIRKNFVIEIIPISRGCLGACSFCKTKKARGNLISYLINDILREAKKALQAGVKEIWLTSQDCGCYGFDLETNLAQLLKKLVTLPYEFKIRVGMMNPDHLLKIVDELIEVYQNPKIFKFLHLPVQSGNNYVLKKMNRNYQVEDYLNLIKKFKEQFSEMTIATDIIVGFPEEADQQYWDTLNLVRNTMPDVVNISRYWTREGTKAAEMKQISGDEIKRRSRVLTEIFSNVSKIQNEKWVGWEGEVILDEPGKEENQWKGRNYAYKPIVIEGDYKLGQIVNVKIKKAEVFYLVGEVND